MKCPKCGFVSYSGLPQCKKCGYNFQKAAPKESSSLISSLLSGKSPPPQEGKSALTPSILGLNEPPPAAPEPVASAPPPPSQELPQAELFNAPPPAPSATDWHEELSDRVEKFKQRRARLRGDASENLDFDFDHAEDLDASPDPDRKIIEFPQAEAPMETDLGNSPEQEPPLVDSLPMENSDEGLRVLTSAAVEAGELTLEAKAHEVEPMEILLPSSASLASSAPQEVSPPLLPLAPLGRRFLAGLADALVLIVGACLFSLIFWRAGGHLSPQPLNLAVLGLIAVFFLMAYFGLFTAVTSSTPGLLWMGLEVRNVEGNYPSGGEAFVRAFGYLVSVSALMLGFLWAAVDSDGLTWHDRMSGTFITVARTR